MLNRVFKKTLFSRGGRIAKLALSAHNSPNYGRSGVIPGFDVSGQSEARFCNLGDWRIGIIARLIFTRWKQLAAKTLSRPPLHGGAAKNWDSPSRFSGTATYVKMKNYLRQIGGLEKSTLRSVEGRIMQNGDFKIALFLRCL